MNENPIIADEISNALREAAALAQREMFSQPKSSLKRLRKKARQIVMQDLQRRAITGEPSPFKRFTQP